MAKLCAVLTKLGTNRACHFLSQFLKFHFNGIFVSGFNVTSVFDSIRDAV